jgi:hypothetical protein
MRRLVILFCVAALTGVPALGQIPFLGIKLLKPDGRMDEALVPECSGLVQSLRYNGVFWALSDSRGPQTIVPVTADGKLARGWSGPVRVEGWKNYDWEDLALDGEGNLIIADVGNNLGTRQQLMLHFVREPKPGAKSVKPSRTLRVHFEDQKTASPDYDCEAVFVAGGRVYFLTKHRTDNKTRLYRLFGESTKSSNPLRLVDSFDIGGMVTAADTSPDGKRVAVLTYTALWVFDYDAKMGSIFRSGIRKLPIFAWQAEAVAFDGNSSVVIGNEEGQLFRVGLDELKVIRP